MPEHFSLDQIDLTANTIRSRSVYQPRIGLILGSGLGEMADAIENADRIPFGELPNWPVSTVLGHTGQLVIGQLGHHALLVMQGRVHYYEGYTMAQVGLPVRVMQRLGIEILIVTNAAGAVNPAYEAGELMLITDHLNLMGMAGLSPLRGPNLDEIGPRFPDMSRAYDRDLGALARQAAAARHIRLHEGVYAGLSGPSFETPADLRFLRGLGVDAVGMSTVPEVTVARHGGQRVLGISGISNKANLDGDTLTTHAEVLAAGKVIAPNMIALIQDVLAQLPPETGRTG
jgi:purine-nucleoside phosphorylase